MEEDKLLEEAREERNEYHRNWAKDHPEAIRRYNSNYWKKRVMKKKGMIKNGKDTL